MEEGGKKEKEQRAEVKEEKVHGQEESDDEWVEVKADDEEYGEDDNAEGPNEDEDWTKKSAIKTSFEPSVKQAAKTKQPGERNEAQDMDMELADDECERG
ncbi:MAG: hypothetical protein MMC33_008513 [Icmadophila ericetorum]|nr:hypothetical protein [Icmadophila ericetorum]